MGEVLVKLNGQVRYTIKLTRRTASSLDGIFGLANCASRADDRLHEQFKPGLARMAAIVTAGDLRAELSLASDRICRTSCTWGSEAEKTAAAVIAIPLKKVLPDVRRCCSVS